jgi:hypothetical protein
LRLLSGASLSFQREKPLSILVSRGDGMLPPVDYFPHEPPHSAAAR